MGLSKPQRQPERRQGERAATRSPFLWMEAVMDFNHTTGTRYLTRKERQNAKSKAWAKKNPEKRAAIHKKYYENHKEQLLQKAKEKYRSQKNADA
jgi:hypothetical protein